MEDTAYEDVEAVPIIFGLAIREIHGSYRSVGSDPQASRN